MSDHETTQTLDEARRLAIEAEVLDVFHDFWHTYGERGKEAVERHLAFWAPDCTGFGTGKDEIVANREEGEALLRREHREIPAPISFSFPWTRVRVLAPTAAQIEGEIEVEIPSQPGEVPLMMTARLTHVFERRDGRWLTVHEHISFPSAAQAEGESFPVDALRARNQQLERLVAERTAALEAAKRDVEVALAELKVTQAQLIQQEKMASLGQLTAGIAHEIKNPLNFVNNFAEVIEELAQELREAYEANPDIKLADLLDIVADLEQNATVIGQHGKRADGIVHAMMQHASGGTGQRESTDINALVSEHIDLAYHGKRAQVPDLQVEVERDLADDAVNVEVIPQDIGRVLLNLLGNAFDAAHEHAAKVTDEYAPTITVSTRLLDSQVEIRVKDNGPGIPSDIKDRIFEPFFTTKPTGSGTGLGLSLSYDIVTQGHGGTLAVESEEGKGATFVITLPV